MGAMETVLVISPHLDDAVLSVGASISAMVEAGRKVIVSTVFAGDPPSPLSPAGQAFHRHCGLGPDAVAVRRGEDLDSAALLGIEAVHLPFPDCLYRRGANGWLYDGPAAAFKASWPAEPSLSAEAVERVRRLIRDVRPAEVWTCLAIGGHVDHRLCRRIVEAACATEGRAPRLWEDLPYSIESPIPKGPTTSVPIEDRDVSRKLAAIAHYRSQVQMLWPEASDWRFAIRSHHFRRRLDTGAVEPLHSGETTELPREPLPV